MVDRYLSSLHLQMLIDYFLVEIKFRIFEKRLLI